MGVRGRPFTKGSKRPAGAGRQPQPKKRPHRALKPGEPGSPNLIPFVAKTKFREMYQAMLADPEICRKIYKAQERRLIKGDPRTVELASGLLDGRPVAHVQFDTPTTIIIEHPEGE